MSDPDPAWQSAIADRNAVLWITLGGAKLPGTSVDVYARLLAQSWNSIYFEDGSLLDRCFADAENLAEELSFKLRRLDGQDNELARLTGNRIGIYVPPLADPVEDPAGFATRLDMFRRVPQTSTVFVISDGAAEDLSLVSQASRMLPDGMREVVILGGKRPAEGPRAKRAVHWTAEAATLAAFAREAVEAADSNELRVRVRSGTGVADVNLTKALDLSYPITDRFQIVRAAELTAEVEATEELVQTLLTATGFDTRPYAAGIVYNRNGAILHDVRRALKKFERVGPEATSTLWIDAEPASGATTALRQLAFDLARDGFPVLVADPATVDFDFQQVVAFLKSTREVATDQSDSRLGEYPWVILFDAEHVARSAEFVTGLANGLRKRRQAAAVVAVRPHVLSDNSGRIKASGPSTSLGHPLHNLILQSEAEAFGEHLNKFLPLNRKRSSQEWGKFCREAERLTGTGKQSLFWVAIRFWLLRMPNAEEPLRQWLARSLQVVLEGSEARMMAVIATAVLSRYRLPLPLRLLTPDERVEIRDVAKREAQGLGLRELEEERRSFISFPHPMIADEILRICLAEPAVLGSLGVSQCSGLLDLQLHVIEKLIPRDSMGYAEVIPILEELVTTALRVDPRSAPSNYAERERIVLMLELAPDSVFDSSEVFLHHLAISRRHLAADPPPTAFWEDPAAVCEQLELAESHLKEAIDLGLDRENESQEKPLNLYVSLALTLAVRAEFERKIGRSDEGDRFAESAQARYLQAQAIDPDNTYVLENYARLKIRQARETTESSERLELLADAISLLDWEMAVDDRNDREEVALEEMVRAYSMLEHDTGLASVRALASTGAEAASVVIARLLAYPDRFSNQTQEEPRLKEAIDLLKRIDPATASWRSRILLHELQALNDPYGFAARLEPLEELDALGEFPWPLKLLYERAILLYQLGEHKRGSEHFQILRDSISSRSSAVFIPDELRFLADPRDEFRSALLTSLRVTKTTDAGSSYRGIPEGWGSTEVTFRPYLFPRQNIRRNDDLDCIIQFTTFGPQAVPRSEIQYGKA